MLQNKFAEGIVDFEEVHYGVTTLQGIVEIIVDNNNGQRLHHF